MSGTSAAEIQYFKPWGLVEEKDPGCALNSGAQGLATEGQAWKPWE